MKIRTKAEMYALYQQGAFGNKLRTWDSLGTMVDDRFIGTVTMRYAGSHGGGWCEYNVPAGVTGIVAQSWRQQGADLNLIRLNESAPDDQLVMQGEVMDSVGGLYLRYSTEQTKMRVAMEHAQSTSRLSALGLLTAALTPDSLEDIRELLSLYDGAVVEFSAYAHCLGNAVGRNAVIWEVRHY